MLKMKRKKQTLSQNIVFFFGVVGIGYMVELHNHIIIKRKDFKNPSKSNLSF